MGRLRVLIRRRMVHGGFGGKSRGGGKSRPRRNHAVVVKLAFAASVVGALMYIAAGNLKEVTESLAVARINYLAGSIINDVIDEVVGSGETEYADLVTLDTDDTGNVSALRTNMVAINRLKAEVSGLVIERINALDSSELGIPLGNLFPSELFSGRGPEIPVVLVPVGTVDTEFESVMLNSGINQTKHRLMLRVTVNVGALLPGFSADTEVSTSVGVAETIIVGKVPGAYTYLEDTGQTGMDIYGDFDLDGGGEYTEPQ